MSLAVATHSIQVEGSVGMLRWILAQNQHGNTACHSRRGCREHRGAEIGRVEDIHVEFCRYGLGAVRLTWGWGFEPATRTEAGLWRNSRHWKCWMPETLHLTVGRVRVVNSRIMTTEDGGLTTRELQWVESSFLAVNPGLNSLLLLLDLRL